MAGRASRIIPRCLVPMLAAVTVAGLALAGTVVPTPQRVTVTGATVSLGSDFSLWTSNASTESVFLEGYVQGILEAGGYSLDSGGSAPLRVEFHLFGDAPPPGGLPADVQPFPAMGDEGYVLVAEPDGGSGVRMVIAAQTQHGLFNGSMTAVSLLLTDQGGMESVLAPQVIVDYPDHPIRGGYLYSINLDSQPVLCPDELQPYCADPVKPRIDELARMKVDWVAQPGVFAMDEDVWAAAQAGLADLRDYCRERFIEFVPAVGSLRNSPLEYRDGWAIWREPFHFEEVAEVTRITNPSFDDDVDCDGVPDGWAVQSSGGGANVWSIDATEAPVVDSPPSMRLDAGDANTASSANMTQYAPAPAPGTYGVRAWIKLENVVGQWFQVHLAGYDDDGTTLLSASKLSLGTQDWTKIAIGPVTVSSAVTQVRLNTRMFGATGTAWLDGVRLLPMVQEGGEWVFVEDLTDIEIAVPDVPSPDLIVNGGFEDGHSGNIPDGWTITDPTDPQADWYVDDVDSHCGGYSMRLEVSGAPASPGESSNDVHLSQTRDGVTVPPGYYIVSGWIKADALQGRWLQVSFRPRLGGQTLVLKSVISDLGTYGWRRFATLLRNDTAGDGFNIFSRVQEPGVGTVWLDDVVVTRIDGALQNVMRDAFDIRVESPDLTTVYQEGIDYEVIDGPLFDQFDDGIKPTVVKRLENGAIPSRGDVVLTYDSNLFWDSKSYSNQGWNICGSRALDEAWGPAIDRLVGTLGATSINLNSDEIRGMNRSAACYDPAGTVASANGELLADFLNGALTRARTYEGDVEAFLWHDMFSNVNNGGWDYQVPYGGPPGPTGEAVSEYGLDTAFQMLVWWYSAQGHLYHQVAEPEYFAREGHQLLVSTWIDQTNIDTWSAISMSQPASRGVVATPWSLNETGVEPSAEAFWNAPHEQVFFGDFEAASASELTGDGWQFVGDATWTDDTSCRMPEERPAGSNPAGLCIGASGGSFVTPSIPADSTATYQVTLFGRSDTVVTTTIDAEWTLIGGGTTTTSAAIGLGGVSGSFERGSVTLVPPTAPPYVQSARLTVAPASGADIALDNVMVWESQPACPSGDVAASAPTTVDAGNVRANKPFTFGFDVCNAGCRTLRVDSANAIPPGNLEFTATVFPLVVPPDECRAIAGSGTAPNPFRTESYDIQLDTNDPSADPTVTLIVTGSPAGN